MSHQEQRNFIQKVKQQIPNNFTHSKVLEIGSLNINGTIRDFFDDCNYIGIDVAFGSGVDIVCEGQNYTAPDNSYDTVCSAECFEHNPYWLETFENMIRLCKPEGLVLFTCATDGRAEHGTSKTDTYSSPLTVEIGWEYYRNLNENDFRNKLNFDLYFEEYYFEVNHQSYDLYFWGILKKDRTNSISTKRIVVASTPSSLQSRIDSIPVIGVPIVNGVHWLKRLIESIDYPVEELFIVNNNGRDQITDELNELTKIPHSFVEKIRVCHLPHNLGVSGAWNLIIKSYIMSPYWIICNNDVAFTPGLLKKMYEESVNINSEMIYAKKSDWGGGAYDLFLIKDFVVQKCGLFDENLYPAYVEDVDYYIRTKNENIKNSFLNIDYLHGEKDYKTSGSQTSKIEINLKEKLNNSRILNENNYIVKKWGENYYKLETYLTPFNNNYDSKYITYDLNFNRKKYLGF